MQKIISLFKRNYGTDYMVRDEVVEGAEWVLAGEGIATRKYDGTCCMVRDGRLYKRYELKRGKATPEGFEAATVEDSKTLKIQGWVSVGEGNEDKYHRSAFEQEQNLPDGTYELIGEKVQGNPEKITGHTLINHANADKYPDFPHNFEGIKAVLKNTVIEGIVWHHPDGRMVKIKRKDFYR